MMFKCKRADVGSLQETEEIRREMQEEQGCGAPGGYGGKGRSQEKMISSNYRRLQPLSYQEPLLQLGIQEQMGSFGPMV